MHKPEDATRDLYTTEEQKYTLVRTTAQLKKYSPGVAARTPLLAWKFLTSTTADVTGHVGCYSIGEQASSVRPGSAPRKTAIACGRERDEKQLGTKGAAASQTRRETRRSAPSTQQPSCAWQSWLGRWCVSAHVTLRGAGVWQDAVTALACGVAGAEEIAGRRKTRE